MTFTADVCDEHPEARVLELPWLHYGAVDVFEGPACTLALFEDNALVSETLREPGGGRVLLVDGGGSKRCALVGDNLAQRAVDNGWAGLVVYGSIRDAQQISQISIGLKALGTHPRRTVKRGEGRRDVAVSIAGIQVHPGQYVYADLDGVVVSDVRY